MAEEIEDVNVQTVEEDGVSGHLKDYIFEPGRITIKDDPDNAGKVKVVTLTGFYSSDETQGDEYWAEPWFMPNHAAYSEPVVGASVWVFRNTRNSNEVYYMLANNLHDMGQGYVDTAVGNGADVINSRNHGYGGSSLTQDSSGGYNMSSPKASVNVGGGGSNASVKTSGGGGVSAKGGKTSVGDESKGTEPAVLGNKLKDLLTGFVAKVTQFIVDLPTLGCVPQAEAYCNDFYIQLNEELEKLGMSDILSDNVDISANAALEEAMSEDEKIEREVDNMSETEFNNAVASMFNTTQFGGQKNWTGKNVANMFTESKSKEFLKTGLKEYKKEKRRENYVNSSKEDKKDFNTKYNTIFNRVATLEQWSGTGAMQKTKNGRSYPLGWDGYKNMSGKDMFNSVNNIATGNMYKSMEKRRMEQDAKTEQELSRRNIARDRALSKYGQGKSITSKQLEPYVEKEYRALVNEENQAEKERVNKNKKDAKEWKKWMEKLNKDSKNNIQNTAPADQVTNRSSATNNSIVEPDWQIGFVNGQMVQRDRNGIKYGGRWVLSSSTD